jgi:hypothetical protein
VNQLTLHHDFDENGHVGFHGEWPARFEVHDDLLNVIDRLDIYFQDGLLCFVDVFGVRREYTVSLEPDDEVDLTDEPTMLVATLHAEVFPPDFKLRS